MDEATQQNAALVEEAAAAAGALEETSESIEKMRCRRFQFGAQGKTKSKPAVRAGSMNLCDLVLSLKDETFETRGHRRKARWFLS